MSSEIIALGSLVLMLALIYAGMHVAITLGLLSFVGVWLIRGDMDIAANLLAQAVSDSIASHIFGVVPLFVLTGFLVAYADVGKDAFEVANQAFRRIRGGLGIATVAANAVFAAITGISIASAAVFTRVAVPQMLRFGYQPRFAVGVVAGSSVLGMLIPPSLLMILYGFLSDQSVGDLFTAGIVPGLILAVAFAGVILLMAWWRPGMVYVGELQPVDDEALMPLSEMLLKMLPIVLLIGSILGGIYTGLFTATEAGAVGALVALLIALVRRKLTLRSFWGVLTETGHVTVSVSFLIICANIYTRMLAMSGTPQAMLEWMGAAGLGVVAFLVIYVVVVVLLGTIIDSSSILLIMLPLMLPIAQQFELNLIWFGVITVVAVEIGLLTPPFGLSIYVIKSTLGRTVDIPLGEMFRGTAPFTLTMLAVLALLMAFPQLSLMLLK
ncbi:TRAP transporter large permease [Hydrogenophaga electricum]|uniref:TRAP transporter large permease protein n=1 Tax=Hydrogenophaga electricum TaxID=1230953 RepID=A0ABQ6CD65_9BURK|nr:TRAP transporter large permease subunit [Hydrogenophaga electricum]GLS16619.1 C4-dicarboxylate ABC transporter permease [Hydrogenophaga electricum]